VIDRDARRALRRHAAQIDTALNDALRAAQVSTIYSTLNQYHVVMEAAPEYWQVPTRSNDVYVSSRRARRCRCRRSRTTRRPTPRSASTISRSS
jgi:multidrug efflux pump subunit AcrB